MPLWLVTERFAAYQKIYNMEATGGLFAPAQERPQDAIERLKSKAPEASLADL